MISTMPPIDGLKHLELEGLPPIFYRENTSDKEIIDLNVGVENTEYVFPPTEPKVVLDIGANIGITSILMANHYPDAIIYAIEPDPENFQILKLNVKDYPNVTPMMMALGEKTESRKLWPSDNPTNHGGFSLHPEHGCDKTAEPKNVACVAINTFIEQIGGKVDIIKIDCEGSEFEIINGMMDKQLAHVSFIFGELHGNRDFDTLAILDKTFELGVLKNCNKGAFSFMHKKSQERSSKPPVNKSPKLSNPVLSEELAKTVLGSPNCDRK